MIMIMIMIITNIIYYKIKISKNRYFIKVLLIINITLLNYIGNTIPK